jgi:hypothetical protein
MFDLSVHQSTLENYAEMMNTECPEIRHGISTYTTT